MKWVYFKWKHDVKNKIADLHIHSTLNKLLMHNFKASVKKKKKISITSKYITNIMNFQTWMSMGFSSCLKLYYNIICLIIDQDLFNKVFGSHSGSTQVEIKSNINLKFFHETLTFNRQSMFFCQRSLSTVFPSFISVGKKKTYKTNLCNILHLTKLCSQDIYIWAKCIYRMASGVNWQSQGASHLTVKYTTDEISYMPENSFCPLFAEESPDVWTVYMWSWVSWTLLFYCYLSSKFNIRTL